MVFDTGAKLIKGQIAEPEMRSLCPELDRVKTGFGNKIKDLLAGIFMKKHA
jgi:hypothetical protein